MPCSGGPPFLYAEQGSREGVLKGKAAVECDLAKGRQGCCRGAGGVCPKPEVRGLEFQPEGERLYLGGHGQPQESFLHEVM